MARHPRAGSRRQAVARPTAHGWSAGRRRSSVRRWRSSSVPLLGGVRAQDLGGVQVALGLGLGDALLGGLDPAVQRIAAACCPPALRRCVSHSVISASTSPRNRADSLGVSTPRSARASRMRRRAWRASRSTSRCSRRPRRESARVRVFIVLPPRSVRYRWCSAVGRRRGYQPGAVAAARGLVDRRAGRAVRPRRRRAARRARRRDRRSSGSPGRRGRERRRRWHPIDEVEARFALNRMMCHCGSFSPAAAGCRASCR